MVKVGSGRAHSPREVSAMAEALTGDRIPVEVNPVLVRQNDVKPLCDDPAKLRSFGDWETQPLAETPGWILRDAKD